MPTTAGHVPGLTSGWRRVPSDPGRFHSGRWFLLAEGALVSAFGIAGLVSAALRPHAGSTSAPVLGLTSTPAHSGMLLAFGGGGHGGRRQPPRGSIRYGPERGGLHDVAVLQRCRHGAPKADADGVRRRRHLATRPLEPQGGAAGKLARRRLVSGRWYDGSVASRRGAPLAWMSGTSANGRGMVGTMPDHSITLVLTAIRH
jgi:hypothetical protein